ncbi:MAG TPA: TolC family protein [Candidatus Kapabacteria bacterium]|nr:TolC family protein [Candidatus Kapabacteria bacterium]
MLLLFLSSNAFAQRVLTLDEAVQFAEQRSPLLQAGTLGVEEASLARREAQLTPYPALKYKLGAEYAPSGRYFGYDPAITNEGQLNAQLSMQGTIYNGGAYGLRKRQADLDIAHARTSLELTREDLRFNVSQSFLEDLRSIANIAIEQESVTELSSYRDLVQRLFKGGTSAYTDLLKTEVQLGEEQVALEKARADEVQARYALAALLGTPSDTAFSVRGRYDSVFTEPAFNMQSYDSLVTMTIALSQNELERARIDIDLARALAKPTVDANADAGLLTSIQNVTAPPDERASMLGASIGISVEGPILDWGLNKVQVQEKEVTAQILQTELDQERRELVAQLTQLQVLLRTSRERIAHIRANLQAAQSAYDLEKAKYAVGAALASEVLDAHKQIVGTKLAELQVLNDIETYRSALEHLTAKPNPNVNTNTNSNNNGNKGQ